MVTEPKVSFKASPRYHGDDVAISFGSSQDSRIVFDNANNEWTLLTKNASGTQKDRIRVKANQAITQLELYGDDPGATGIRYDLYHDSASPAASDVPVEWRVYGKDGAGNKTQYGGLKFTITDPTDASEDGKAAIQVLTAGTLRDIETPSVTANDTFAVLGLAQTFTADQSLSAAAIKWAAGKAVIGTEYSVVRDLDATNQLHLNVPTGAGIEISVNDVAALLLSNTIMTLIADGVEFDIRAQAKGSGNNDAGIQVNLEAGNAGTSTTGNIGGPLVLKSGAAGGTGNNHGGRLRLETGSATGTGLKPLVEIDGAGSVPTTAVLGTNKVGFKYNAAGTLVAYVNDAGVIKSLTLGTPA